MKLYGQKQNRRYVGIILCAFIFTVSFLYSHPVFAKGVGGKFLPGVFDIFTPSLTCGLLVSVIEPNGIIGVYTWLPVSIYDYFMYAPTHIGNSMLGNSPDAPPGVCPPVLYMVGTSIAP